MTDITLRQFAPILGAMLEVKGRYERLAERHREAELFSNEHVALSQAKAIEDAIKAAIDAATTETP